MATVIRQLYCALVHPIVKTNSPAWNPWLKKDKDRLDRVQHYTQKLCSQDLELLNLTYRRYRTDMRETYKLLNGIYKTNSSYMFTVGGREGLHGHEKKLTKHATQSEHVKSVNISLATV